MEESPGPLILSLNYASFGFSSDNGGQQEHSADGQDNSYIVLTQCLDASFIKNVFMFVHVLLDLFSL